MMCTAPATTEASHATAPVTLTAAAETAAAQTAAQAAAAQTAAQAAAPTAAAAACPNRPTCSCAQRVCHVPHTTTTQTCTTTNPQTSKATQATNIKSNASTRAHDARISGWRRARNRTSEDIAINLRRRRQEVAVACDAFAGGGWITNVQRQIQHDACARKHHTTFARENTTQRVRGQGVHLKPCRVRSRHSSGENVWMPTARPARASCGAIWRAKNERENNPKYDCAIAAAR